MSQLPTIPADWADQAGWETYYAALYPDGPFRSVRGWAEEVAAMIGGHLAGLMKHLLEQKQTRVWFAGCGLEPLPKVFAQFGLSVCATDVAPTAVRFQQSADNDVTKLTERYATFGLTPAQGAFNCSVHDFREPCPDGPFDLVMNFKSLQGFSGETLKRIAEAHFHSLKPGRSAYFDTMNVQGERRDVLEQALADAGFHVPLHKSNTWLRRSLRETAIPHVFILGKPMIPRHGEYAFDEEKVKRDQARLMAIFAEYQQRAQAEHQGTKVSPEAKTAVVIYNTG
jgi:hypothetical protein